LIANLQFPIARSSDKANPPSPIPDPKSKLGPRSGVTLLEVLSAILVTSVGLLGAIAVFPVALAQVRKGKQADMVAVAGDTAAARFDAQYMRRPDRWLWWDTASNQRRSLIYFDNLSVIAKGRGFCIDPRFYEQNRLADLASGQNNSSLWAFFPAVPANMMGVNPAPPNAVPHFGRMLRLSLHHALPGADGAWGTTGDDDGDMVTNEYDEVGWHNSDDPVMTLLQADSVFKVEDELIFQRPDDNTLPAVQLFTQMTTQQGPVRGRRQEEGRLSWMATLVPRGDRLGRVDNTYVLSIVIFYDRPPDLVLPNSAAARPYTEWTAKILAGGFHSGGFGGGEVTITTNDPAEHANDPANNRPNFNNPDALDLRRGSWIALGRTIPAATGPADNLQHLQWYRVSSTEDSPRAVDLNNDGTADRWQRDVTLVGPDFPADLDGNNVAEECDVIIMPSVVHVIERTIRLDVETVGQ
jgi:hypothetical protein